VLLTDCEAKQLEVMGICEDSPAATPHLEERESTPQLLPPTSRREREYSPAATSHLEERERENTDQLLPPTSRRERERILTSCRRPLC
jgi:hypothetical protein